MEARSLDVDRFGLIEVLRCWCCGWMFLWIREEGRLCWTVGNGITLSFTADDTSCSALCSPKIRMRFGTRVDLWAQQTLNWLRVRVRTLRLYFIPSPLTLGGFEVTDVRSTKLERWLNVADDWSKIPFTMQCRWLILFDLKTLIMLP